MAYIRVKNKEMNYTKNYIEISRGDLIKRIEDKLSQDRFNHILRVEATALELADRFQADSEKVSIAALLHDYAKEVNMDELRNIVINENLDLELLDYGNSILHGPVGSVCAYDEFGVTDKEILNAIYYHTIGRKNMSLVEKVIFVADYTEPHRDFPQADKARDLAQDDLDQAVTYIVKETLLKLIKDNKLVYPGALDTYNSLIA